MAEIQKRGMLNVHANVTFSPDTYLRA